MPRPPDSIEVEAVESRKAKNGIYLHDRPCRWFARGAARERRKKDDGGSEMKKNMWQRVKLITLLAIGLVVPTLYAVNNCDGNCSGSAQYVVAGTSSGTCVVNQWLTGCIIAQPCISDSIAGGFDCIGHAGTGCTFPKTSDTMTQRTLMNSPVCQPFWQQGGTGGWYVHHCYWSPYPNCVEDTYDVNLQASCVEN